MPEPALSNLPEDVRLRERLQEVTRALRQAHHLEPNEQQTLSAVLAELGQAKDLTALSPEQKGHLAESLEHLTQALHHQHDRHRLQAARDRFEQAVLQVEAKSSVVTGLLHRLLDTLANIGI
jgi:hypothetical protein